MTPTVPVPRAVLVLGAGIVGVGCAWRLQRRGHAVTLVAPDLAEPLVPPEGACGGSRAALGVLMADLFHRRSGRAWRLRQRSRTLWEAWRDELASRGQPLPWRPGLLRLAADAAERERLQRQAGEGREAGLPLRWLEPAGLAVLQPALPGSATGGLLSPRDGQIDPLAALAALQADAGAAGLVRRPGTARALEPWGGGWRVRLSDGETLDADAVVLAAGCGATPLLAALAAGAADPGPDRSGTPIEPVLGQALELELAADDAPPPPGGGPGWDGWRGWPGAVSWRGINLVPRPDLPGGRRFWLGATLEPGERADPQALAALRRLEGDAPAWLARARVLRHWHGLRPRPQGRPAPLLEEPWPGLLLAGGHARNGVLLTPASAEWVCDRVEGRQPRP